MIRTQRIGAFAVVGAVAAALAFGGLAAARADELSDLQANVQLLQKEVARLQQRGADPAVQAGSFHAAYHGTSFLMPGTNTSIAISGYVDLQAEWILTGGGEAGGTNGLINNVLGQNGLLPNIPLDRHGQRVPGFPTPGNIVPVDLEHSRGASFGFTPRQSRIRVQTETPTWLGPASTMFEFDFLGGGPSNALQVSDSLNPRLRLAFGTLGPWLGGQNYSLMDDLEASDNTIDFSFDDHVGPTRIPQLRYTQKLPYGLSAAVAAEAPATDLWTPLGRIDRDFTGTVANGTVNPAGGFVNPAKNTYPDAVGAFTWHQPWGHLQLHGDLRSLEFNDGRFFDKQFVGIEGGFSGNLKPGWLGWTKDNITWDFGYGEGGGRANGAFGDAALETNYGAFPILTAADAAHVRITTVSQWVGHVSYTHWWLPNLETNIDYNIDHDDLDTALIGPKMAIVANRELWFTHVNLLWHPVAFAHIGVEWLHGQRQVVAKLRGNMDAILGDFRVSY